LQDACAALPVDVLVAKDTDPVWSNRASWVWRETPAFASVVRLPAPHTHGKVEVMAIDKRLGLSLLFLCGAVSLRGSDDINWLGSYREGLRVAGETGKPLLVEFRCEA
jgi:hypothetical protein